MIKVEDKARRIIESAAKIQRPFVLDESMCFYSPQDNVDALRHPRVEGWLRYIEDEYEPQLPAGVKTVLLLLPCTKIKPYPFSSEHKAINQRLLESGFRPSEPDYLPRDLLERLERRFEPDVLNLSALSNDEGVVIHRMVISEPLGLVPYECIATFKGGQSPAVCYDNPGLLEDRGNAVSPWRSDCTALRCSGSRWEWGDEERRQYVVMHNRMSETLAKIVARIGHRYDDMIAWVAPGLTHRSFILHRDERSLHKVPATRRVGNNRAELIGANDRLINSSINCFPTREQCQKALMEIATRLNVSKRKALGTFARGGVGATPLALPELLDTLVARIGRLP